MTDSMLRALGEAVKALDSHGYDHEANAVREAIVLLEPPPPHERPCPVYGEARGTVRRG